MRVRAGPIAIATAGRGADPGRQTAPRTATPRARDPAPAPSSTYLGAGSPERSPEEVGRRVRILIDALAPLLGLDPGQVRLVMRHSGGPPHAASRGETITVTGSLDPGSIDARLLLLHELTHARQHRNRGRRPARRPNLSAAEAEAAGLTAALREGRVLWVPQQTLPDGHLARDTGAIGTAPQTASPTATATTPDVASLEKRLDDIVLSVHSGDARMIEGQLDHPWTQTHDEMVENCLRILSTMPFVVARSIVRQLTQPVRLRLALLRDMHHDKYPETCVAVLSALTAEEFAKLGGQGVGMQPYPGATMALHGVEPTRLSATARRALLAALRRLPVTTLTLLEKSDRRDVFRGLLGSGPDTGTDEAELRKAIAAEERRYSSKSGAADDLVVAKIRRLLADANTLTAKESLTVLDGAGPAALPGGATKPQDQPAVATPPSTVTLEDLRAALSKPKGAGTGSNAPPELSPEFAALVAKLDREGLIDKVLDELPEQDRYSDTYRDPVKRMLAARDPLLNLERATTLLSYGLFDWKIFDAEARFAYLLVRSTSIAAQDAWRVLDNGKWLHRLEDNLPDDMMPSGEYTGVGSEYQSGAGDDLGVSARMLQAHAEEFITRWDKLASPLVAKAIVRELLGLDIEGKPKPWLTDLQPAQSDPALRTAIIRRIDARLKLDDIIAALPDDYLFGEQGRHELLDLNQLRDPVHLIQQARDLVPSGFFGWITYTHRNAWLAAQAIRGLAPAAQERFAIDNPGLWTVLWAGLTAEMRRDLPTVLATGLDPRLPTRESIRDRLKDERLWTEAAVPDLRSLIDLAYAADDRAWVFEKSAELRADRRPGLEAVVKDYGLFSEADKRTDFKPQLTAVSRAPVWGNALGVIGRALGILLYDWLVEDSIRLSGKTMHLKGFNLGDVQTIVGGDIEGVTLAPSSGGSNQIDVDATFAAGFVVNADLKDLEIAGVNIVLPGKSYRCGPISVKGLKATAGFSDRHYHDPTYIGVSLDSLALRDLVLIDPSLPFSAAWAIAQLALKTLSFKATQDGSGDPLAKIGQSLPKGTIPIPIFGPLFQMLSNIVSIQGAIPGDLTLLDLALLPVHLPFPTTSILDQAFPTPAPATYLWGLAADGVLRPPYSAAQRVKDSLGMLRAFSVGFTSLQVDGISIGSGQQIRSLTLTDVNVSVGQSLPAYLNTALATVKAAQAKLPKNSQQYKDLDGRIATLQAQIANVEASPRLATLRAKRAHDPGALTDAERKELALADEKSEDEGRLAELEAKDRWNPGSLTEPERARLIELTRKLRSDVGMTAEIGSITLGPLSGSIQAAGVSLKGIHTSVRVPNVGLLPLASSFGYLDDKSLAEQFVKGGPRIPTVGELAKSSEFSLAIDETTILNTDPKQPAVVIRATHIPRASQLKAEIDALPDIEGNRPVRERLMAAYDTVLALERARGTAELAPSDAQRAAAKQKVRELTDDAERLLGIEIGGIKFGRISGELDPNGKLTATVHDAEITKLAGPGYAVEKITGSLQVGLEAGGIKARPDQLDSAVAGQLRPGVVLKDVTATGISFAKGSIASAKIGRLSGSIQVTETGYRIPDLVLDQLQIDAVAIGKEGDGLVAQTVFLRGLSLDAEVAVQKTSTGSKLTRAVIHSLSIAELGGEHVVLDMPQEKGSLHAELIGGSLHNISASEVIFEEGSEGFGLTSGSAGVGSFADVRYSLAVGALKSRTTVTGTLTTAKEGVAAKRPTIEASYATAGGRRFSLSLQDLEALGTDISTPDGRVTIRQVNLAAALTGTEAGMKANATLTGLAVGPISWAAGTGRLQGGGPIVAHKVTVAAFYTPAVPAPGKQKAKPAAWTVTDIVITGLEGEDLRYIDPPIDMRLGQDGKPATPGEPPLKVGRIHIQPALGKLQVEDLRADFRASLTSSLNVGGHLGIDFFSMELHRDGHVVAMVKGVSAEVAVSGDYTGAVELKGLQGATIDVGPDAIRIGGADPDDPSGLQIDQLSFASLKLTSVAGGHRFTLSTQKNGRVDLLGIVAKVRIDRWLPSEPHKTNSPFKAIAIERLTIDRINLSALRIDLPDDDLTIVVPARADSDPPTLHGLQLTGSADKDNLWHDEFMIDLEGGGLKGGVEVSDIALPVSVALKDKFKGDVALTTGRSTIDFLSGGGVRIDVTKPRVTMAKAAELGKNETIRFARIGADELTFADGRLVVRDAFLEDLEYTQTVGGTRAVWLKVKVAKTSDVGYDTAYGGSLTVGSLDIQDANLELDLTALIPPPTAAAKQQADALAASGEYVPPAFEIENLRPIADEVEGSVDVVMYVAASVGGLKDFRIGSDADPLSIQISHGAIDISALERSLKGKVEATQIGEGWYLRPGVVNAVARDPVLKLKGNTLQLGVYIVDPANMESKPDTFDFTEILTWELRAPDFTRAQANEFALWAAMFHFKSSIESIDPEERKKKAAETKDLMDSIELRRLVADLSVKNTSPLTIKISGTAASGEVVLSPKALQHLRVSGGLGAVSPPPERPGSNPNKLDVSLEALRVDKVGLWLGPNRLSTGSITIQDLVDASLTFDNLNTPRKFTAKVTKANAKDITWYRWRK